MSQTNFLRLSEGLFVFALGFGLFISKPVIYAASAGLVLIFLFSLVFEDHYRKQAVSSGWVRAAVVIYLFGILATLIHPATWPDVYLYARKALFLLVFAAMWLGCHRKQTRKAAMAGALVGFWLATALTIYKMPWAENIHRLHGATWPIDIWGVLCAFMAVFMLPHTLSPAYSTFARVGFGITMFTAVIFMLLSGSRGPTLAVILTVGLYLLIRHRGLLLLAILAIAVAYWPAKMLWPNQIGNIEARIHSVGHGTLDESSWIRMQLWKLSLAQDEMKWRETPLTLLFGSGPQNHLQEIRSFFNRTDSLDDQTKERLSKQNYPSNDVHNMYLDTTAKMGILWTLAVLLFLCSLLVFCWKGRHVSRGISVAGSLVIMSFLITGIFYDAMLHFNSTFMIFFAALSASSVGSGQS